MTAHGLTLRSHGKDRRHSAGNPFRRELRFEPLEDRRLLSVVALWKFDEGAGSTTTDATGNGHTGTLVNSPAWVAGHQAKALNFNGSSQYVTVADAADLDIGTGNFTVAMWIKPTNTVGGNRYVLYKGGGDSTDKGYCIYYATDSTLHFQVSNGDGSGTADKSLSSDALTTNQWAHVAWTIQRSGNMSLYVNGVLQSSLDISNWSATTDFGNTRTLGLAAYSGGSMFFPGQLDDVRIFNQALSAIEVTTVYNEGFAPVARWKFDEGTGQSASDATGNGHTGTLVNSPAWVAGRQKAALSFNGSNQYMTAADTADLDIGTGDFTVAMWVKPTNTVSSNKYVLYKGGGGSTDKGYCIYYDADSTLHFQLSNGDGSGTADKSLTFGPLMTNQWVHVTWTIQRSGAMSLYVNGVLQSLLDISNWSTTTDLGNTQALRLASSGGSMYFPGQLDDVRIYNQALDANTIFNLSLGMAAHLKFDEGTGSTTTDATGNGHTGTLAGSPAWVTGHEAKALSCNGSTQYATVADTIDLDIGPSEDFTVAMWVKPTNTVSSNKYVLYKGGGGSTDKGYCIYYDADETLHFQLSNGDGSGTADKSLAFGSLTTNQWVHVAWTIQRSSDMSLYVNGVLRSSLDISNWSTTTDFGNTQALGLAASSGGSLLFPGQLDDVRIIRKEAISAAEVYLLSQFPDLTPPVAVITSPEASDSVSGVVTISATVSDNFAVADVLFQVDGVTIGKCVTSPYKVSWNTTQFSSGTHTLSVVAYDAAGNSSTTSIGSQYSGVKFIEWGYQGSNTLSTQYVHDNITAMETTADGHVFDGATLRLKSANATYDDVYYWLFSTPDGGQNGYAYNFNDTGLQADITNLQGISSGHRFMSNMFTYACMGTSGSLPDWFDSWSTPLNNLDVVARIAATTSYDQPILKGIIIDPEPYNQQFWDYESQKYASTYTLAQYETQVWTRGKQAMQTLTSRYPGITVMILFGFSAPTDWELLPYFVAGMLDGAQGTSATIHEVSELAYGYTKESQYSFTQQACLNNAQAIVTNPPSSSIAPISLANYRTGYGKWADYMGGHDIENHPEWDWVANCQNGPLTANYYPPDTANSYSPGWEQALAWAATHTQQYVWCYNEVANWWTGISDTPVPQAYVDASDAVRSLLTTVQSSPTVTVANGEGLMGFSLNGSIDDMQVYDYDPPPAPQTPSPTPTPRFSHISTINHLAAIRTLVKEEKFASLEELLAFSVIRPAGKVDDAISPAQRRRETNAAVESADTLFAHWDGLLEDSVAEVSSSNSNHWGMDITIERLQTRIGTALVAEVQVGSSKRW